MDYVVTLQETEEYLVSLRERRRGLWEATLDSGKVVEMELRGRDEDGDFLIVIDGELRRFGVDRNEGGYDLIENAAQTRYPVDVVNAAQIVLTSVFEDHVESDVPLAEAMVSPITGIVLDVLVKPGQHVLEGDPVVVVEAMKMENTFRAHQAGTIAEVCVMESQTIFVNDALVHIR